MSPQGIGITSICASGRNGGGIGGAQRESGVFDRRRRSAPLTGVNKTHPTSGRARRTVVNYR
jgi:hypothetical protein